MTGEGISRRTFGRLAGLAAGTAALGLNPLLPPPWARGAEGDESRPIIGIDLDPARWPVPFAEAGLDAVMAPAPQLLDELARRYWEEESPRGVRLSEADFFFRWLPMPLFGAAVDGVTAGSVLAGRPLIEAHLWLMHLVGYYGGVWFGKKLDEFNPIAGAAERPRTSSGDFGALITYLERALTASGEGREPMDESVVDFAGWALRGDFVADNPDGLLQSLITLYGYNVGYTDNILRPPHRAAPAPYPLKEGHQPPSPFRPPYNSMVATPPGVFDARYPDYSQAVPPSEPVEFRPVPPDPSGAWEPVTYLIGDAAGLAATRLLWDRARQEAASEFERIMNGDPAQKQVPLSAQQAAAYRVGDTTWSVPFFLDVKRWDAKSYDEIVGMSIFFVQAVQQAGMACMASAALGDEAAAHDATLAAALVQPFGGSYLVGLSAGGTEPYADLAADDAIPRFRRA